MYNYVMPLGLFSMKYIFLSDPLCHVPMLLFIEVYLFDCPLKEHEDPFKGSKEYKSPFKGHVKVAIAVVA